MLDDSFPEKEIRRPRQPYTLNKDESVFPRNWTNQDILDKTIWSTTLRHKTIQRVAKLDRTVLYLTNLEETGLTKVDEARVVRKQDERKTAPQRKTPIDLIYWIADLVQGWWGYDTGELRCVTVELAGCSGWTWPQGWLVSQPWPPLSSWPSPRTHPHPWVPSPTQFQPWYSHSTFLHYAPLPILPRYPFKPSLAYFFFQALCLFSRIPFSGYPLRMVPFPLPGSSFLPSIPS